MTKKNIPYNPEKPICIFSLFSLFKAAKKKPYPTIDNKIKKYAERNTIKLEYINLLLYYLLKFEQLVNYDYKSKFNVT